MPQGDTVISLGKLTDFEGDSFTVQLSGLSEGMSYTVDASNEVWLMVTQSAAKNGSFTIPVNVKETVGEKQVSTTLSVTVQVKGLPEPPQEEEDAVAADEANTAASSNSTIPAFLFKYIPPVR